MTTLLPDAMFLRTTETKTTLYDQIITAQRANPTLMRDWAQTQGVRKEDQSAPWTKDGNIAVPPDVYLKRQILAQIHDAPSAGHPGRDLTITAAKRTYWWPAMNQWIEGYVRGCAACQQNKNLTHRRKTPLYRIPVPPAVTSRQSRIECM